jgi:uncharacterized protein YyaL (SSP411 family)
LARETSPYLLLHAHNPVDWYPWGEEAFEKARRDDKPIFLSVGYSTCYWCHVMERESFSSPEIAAQLNDAFVSIKLDREERPDLDEVYMAATQLLTRSGGWPNSLFLTPDLKPFFAGTYFPPHDAMGRPGFPRVLTSLREAWALRRAEVVAQAEAIAEAMGQHLAALPEPGPPPGDDVVAATQRGLASRFDPVHGGFSRAPKFPSPSNLFFLLDRAEAGDGEAREMLATTLDRMARGGIFDQIGGGFHRYSVDGQWLVPHFEKMLYDNASLARLYAAAHPLAPELGFDRVARATLDFVRRELTGEDGAFLSAIDAETDGHEGAYYVWSTDELHAALSPEAYELLSVVYGFDGPPNFEDELYVLHLPQPLAEVARARGTDVAALLARIEPFRVALLRAREQRKRPLVDDKVLGDWNGLMIGAMADAGRRLSAPEYVQAAARAADVVLDRLRGPSGELLHAFRGGRAHVAAMLDDYAFLVEGLLLLASAANEPRYRDAAARLADEQERRLGDEVGGYFAAGHDPRLLFRGKPAHDGAVASGNGISALNLLELHEATGEARYRDRAVAALGAFGPDVERMPQGHVTLVRAVARLGTAPAAAAAAASAPVAAAPALGSEALEDEAREAVEVTARLDSGHQEVRGFRVELKVKKGFHAYAHEPGGEGLLPTRLTGVLGQIESVHYPKGETGPDGVRVYTGTVALEGTVRMPKVGAPSVELHYQVCDSARCLPAVARLVRL